LGLILSRVLPPLPWTRFRRPSSLALPAAAIALTAATRRLGVSIGIGLARSCNPASRTGPNNPPEVPAPSKSQIFEPTTTRAMRSPCGSPTVTRQLSRALDRPHRLCRSHLGLDCGAWPKQPPNSRAISDAQYSRQGPGSDLLRLRGSHTLWQAIPGHFAFQVRTCRPGL